MLWIFSLITVQMFLLALRGGNNIRGALIGQGVHASHGMERTHIQGMENTLELVKAFAGVEAADD